MKNSVTKISDYKEVENDNDVAWNEVKDAYQDVIAFKKIQPKALPRVGKAMQTAILRLIDSLVIYDHMRGKK
jgi:hypothetical protein